MVALTKVNRGGLNTGISDSSDATFLTVDSSEQAVIKSEGGAVTTSVQQGLLKSWAYFIATMGSVADSFNISSVADEGTGDSGMNLSNAMSSVNYVGQGTVQTTQFQNTAGNVRIVGFYSKTTTKMNFRSDYIVNDQYAGGYEGSMYHNVSSSGDLA